MEVRLCKHCGEQFQALYMSDRYCNQTCKKDAKVKAKLEKWANGKCHCERPKNHQRPVCERWNMNTEY